MCRGCEGSECSIDPERKDDTVESSSYGDGMKMEQDPRVRVVLPMEDHSP